MSCHVLSAVTEMLAVSVGSLSCWLLVFRCFTGFYLLTSPPGRDDRGLTGALWYCRVMLGDVWGLMWICSSMFTCNRKIRSFLPLGVFAVLVTNWRSTQVGEIRLKPGCVQVLKMIWNVWLVVFTTVKPQKPFKILIHFQHKPFIWSDFFNK